MFRLEFAIKTQEKRLKSKKRYIKKIKKSKNIVIGQSKHGPNEVRGLRWSTIQVSIIIVLKLSKNFLIGTNICIKKDIAYFYLELNQKLKELITLVNYSC